MRQLVEDERRVLGVMLAQDLPGAVELRAQVNAARVVSRCECGCPSVDSDVPRAAVVSRTPVSAEVEGVLGGGLIVFVDDGHLSRLEYYSAEDHTPRSLPKPVQIRPHV